MADSEDFLGEDFEWKDEPGPPRGNGSRVPAPSRQPRPIEEDLAGLRKRATASRGRLAVLALTLAASVAIILAVVLSAGENKKANSEATTTSPETTPAQTQPEPSGEVTARPAITVSPATTLRAGDRGPAVRTLQRALRRLDPAVGSPDGVFGPKTEAAVIAFQRAHGLSPDGVVGAKTAQAINSALARAG